MKEYAAAFYASAAWKKARRTYIAHRIEVDGGLCEECHEALGYIVHHRKELTPENINDINVTLDPSNIEYVCKDCHDRFEGHWIGPARPREIKKYFFSADGEPVPRLPP